MDDELNWLPRGRGRYDLTVGYTRGVYIPLDNLPKA